QNACSQTMLVLSRESANSFPFPDHREGPAQFLRECRAAAQAAQTSRERSRAASRRFRTRPPRSAAGVTTTLLLSVPLRIPSRGCIRLPEVGWVVERTRCGCIDVGQFAKATTCQSPPTCGHQETRTRDAKQRIRGVP